MTPRKGPTLRRRRLANKLREIRNNAGLSSEEVAEQLGWSASKVTFMERKDSKRPDPHDVALVLDVYGVADTEVRDELVTLAREGRKRGWWFERKDSLTRAYQEFLDFEAEASTCFVWEPMVVPGVIQTPEYARALIVGGPLELPEKEIEHRVGVRMDRQEVLIQSDSPLRLHAVMDEAAIRRPVGGSTVMRAQLRRLLDAAELPNLTLQVMPFDAGAHAGTLGSFSILEFPDPGDHDVVYAESVDRETFLEDPDEVLIYHRTFRKLSAVAASPADTIKMIAAVADGK